MKAVALLNVAVSQYQRDLPILTPPCTHTLAAGCGAYKNRSRTMARHSNLKSWDAGKMPASQTGFGNFFLERSISMPAGYQIPVLGCPPGVQQQQQAQHLAAMAAGVPVAYSGLQGYNFIPYPHHRPITHMVSEISELGCFISR